MNFKIKNSKNKVVLKITEPSYSTHKHDETPSRMVKIPGYGRWEA